MSKKISPEKAIEFLEDFRKLKGNIDKKTKAISLRVPENLIDSLKLKAELENKKYQSLIIKAIREYLQK